MNRRAKRFRTQRPLKVILDNDVVSALYRSRTLDRVIRAFSKGTFLITEQVWDEAMAWTKEIATLGPMLETLERDGMLTRVIPEVGDEVATYAQLVLHVGLGRGEAASIAVAYHRKCCLATDDALAIKKCSELDPLMVVIRTHELRAKARL